MFIAKNNDLIIIASQSREGLEQALQFMVYTSIEETDIEYKLYNGQYLTQEEIDKQELERVSNLTMTSLDLIGYLRNTGLTLKEINDFLDENLELKTQLTYCQNCYCGVVASICPLVIGDVIIDKMQVIEWFKDKNNEDTTDTDNVPVQFTSENTLEEGEITNN